MKQMQYDDELKNRLSPKRFQHTMGVVLAAEDLAIRNGIDVNKAKLAALLHDITKECCIAEQLELLEEFSLPLTELEKHSPKLWHAITGASFIKHRYKIVDKDIIDAVRYHTTGRKNMTTLDKIIYLADYIEVNRDFPGVDEVRGLIDDGLDAMMYQAMKQTIEELLDKSAAIHPDTLECYNQLVLERV